MSDNKESVNPSEYFFDRSPSICKNIGTLKLTSLRNQLLKESKDLSVDNEECDLNTEQNLQLFLHDKKTQNRSKVIISDFQKPIVTKIDTSLNHKITLVHFPDDLRGFNVFVDSLWTSEAFIKADLEMVLSVKLKNSGVNEARDVIVEYKLDGTSVSSKTVNFSRNSYQKLNFPLSLRSSGFHKGEIIIKDNSWDFDNRFYFSLSTAKRVSIANVANDRSSLDPVQLAYSQDKIFDISNTDFTSNSSRILQKSNLIVYHTNSSNFTLLSSYLKTGKTALMFVSSAWGKEDIKKLNQALSRNVISFKEKSEVQIEEPDLNNPFFYHIFEAAPVFQNLPKVNSLCFLSNPDEILLKATNGEPLIGRYKIGNDQIYISSFNLEDNISFSRHAIFLPVLYKIAESSMQRSIKPYYFHGTKSLEFVSQQTYENLYSLSLDSYKLIPDQKVQSDLVKLIFPEKGLNPGIWKISDKKDSVIAEFGVNISKSESEVDFYSFKDLEGQFKNHSNVQVVKLEEYKKEFVRKELSSEGLPYWRLFLLISFAFLAIEVLISRFYKFA